ncbi:hypothetical protein Vretimale_11969, partial [Volvox reticuliferus]
MPAIFQWDCTERSCVLTVAGQQIKQPPHVPLPVDCTNDLLMGVAMHQTRQQSSSDCGKSSGSESHHHLLTYAALPLMSGPRIIGVLWLGAHGVTGPSLSGGYSNGLESSTTGGSSDDSSRRCHHRCPTVGTDCSSCQKIRQQQQVQLQQQTG